MQHADIWYDPSSGMATHPVAVIVSTGPIIPVCSPTWAAQDAGNAQPGAVRAHHWMAAAVER